MNIIEKIFGTHSENELKRIYPIVDKIEALGPEMEALSDEELRGKTREFKERLKEGENLSRAQERIEETMDALIKGFDKQLDDLYRNEAMDIDSDIRVMENMLRRDTASVEDDFGLGGAAVQRAPDEE